VSYKKLFYKSPRRQKPLFRVAFWLIRFLIVRTFLIVRGARPGGRQFTGLSLSLPVRPPDLLYYTEKAPRYYGAFSIWCRWWGGAPPSKASLDFAILYVLLRRPSGTPTKNNTNIAQTAIFSPFSLNTRLKYSAVRLLSYFSKIIVNNTIWVDASLTL